MIRRAILAAIAAAAALPAHAQQTDEQLWQQLNVNVPLTPELRVTLEQIRRWSDRAEGLMQTQYGALGVYAPVKGVEIGIGYRRVGLFTPAQPAVYEDRLREQVVVTRGHLVARFRLDQFFDPRGRDVGIRILPFVRYNLPIGRKGFGFFASHESIYLPNSTDWGQRAGYDRMRNIVGVTVPIVGRKLTMDAGYLNQFRVRNGPVRAQMDHILTLQFTLNALGPILHD